VNDIVTEIAAAGREQASGIDQVNRAVTLMDRLTQSNAAQTEELSSTAQALAVQAEQLQALVARFLLERAEPAGTAEVRMLASAAAAARMTSTRAVPRPPLAARVPVAVTALRRNGPTESTDDGFEEF